jgi:hypothetical protein
MFNMGNTDLYSLVQYYVLYMFSAWLYQIAVNLVFVEIDGYLGK